MSSHAKLIKDYLATDTGAGKWNTILTGGTFVYEDAGRFGISRQSLASAYDTTTGLLKPCSMIRERSLVPIPGVYDPNKKLAGVQVMIEIYVLGDGDAGYDTIDAALARAYYLLQGHRLTGWFDCQLTARFNRLREAELTDACKGRADYRIVSALTSANPG